MNTIKEIMPACRSCRTYSKRLFRFCASIPPEKAVFNQELAIDLVCLDGKPVLHILDTHTHLQNTIPIRTKKEENVWYASVEGWASI